MNVQEAQTQIAAKGRYVIAVEKTMASCKAGSPTYLALEKSVQQALENIAHLQKFINQAILGGFQTLEAWEKMLRRQAFGQWVADEYRDLVTNNQRDFATSEQRALALEALVLVADSRD